jgi:hypothetical protein
MSSRKEKIKKRLTTIAFILIAAAVIGIGVYAFVQDIIWNSKVETYSDGTHTVRLLPDGTFTADLAHTVNFHGTYEKRNFDFVIIINFFIDGSREIGWLKDDVLQIPSEWEHDLNYDTFLPRR